MNLNLNLKGMMKWPRAAHVSNRHQRTEGQSETGTETIITCIVTKRYPSTRERVKQKDTTATYYAETFAGLLFGCCRF